MPAIKVYHYKGQKVPVDRAKTSKAFECPWTKKIFMKKADYVNHLKKRRELSRKKIHFNNRVAAAIEDFNNLSDFDKIVKWLDVNSWVLHAVIKNSYEKSFFDYYIKCWEKVKVEDFYIKIHGLQLRHVSNIPNTHSCPRNGVTNYYSHPSLPRSYPGWEGAIALEFSHDIPRGLSENFREIGINIRIGGSSSKIHRYSVQLFDADWPGLEKKALISTLSEQSLVPYSYGVKVW